MEEAVADGGDRGGGERRRPGAVARASQVRVGVEDAVEVGGAEEVVLGGAGAAHRLLVDGEEAGALLGASSRARGRARSS